jgi:hypothetical protein
LNGLSCDSPKGAWWMVFFKKKRKMKNIDLRIATEKEAKIIQGLFIGKVAELIGYEKTIELLREARTAILSGEKKDDSN